MASSLGLHPAARRHRHRRIVGPQTAGVDVELPFRTATAVGSRAPIPRMAWSRRFAFCAPFPSIAASAFPETFADILRLMAELRPLPITSTA